MRVLLLIGSLSLALPAPAPCQDVARGWALSASAQVGTATDGTGSSSSITLRVRRAFARLRWAGSDAVLSRDANNDVGVEGGITLLPLSPRTQLTLGAGVGRATLWRRDAIGCTGSCRGDSTTVTSLIAGLELRQRLVGLFGLSGYAFLDRNSQHSFAGLVIGIYFGRI